MIKRGNKRGLSEVITNLLLITLVLVAVGIIWVVVRSLISQGAEGIDLSQITLDVSIQRAYVSGTDVVVGVRRSPGAGNLLGMKFLFINLNQEESVTVEKMIPLNELEERTLTFTEAEVPGIGAGDEVSVSPIYGSSGNEKLGGLTDSATISGSPPGSGGIGPPNTGTCGDSTVENPNGEDPQIFEECDTNNLAGQSCTGLNQGFTGGILSCTSGCMFDTSQCTGATPASCNGTWTSVPPEDIDVECDGTPLPNGCSASCMCETGFHLDNAGGCTLNSPVNTGTINSVWNIFFDSDQLEKDDSVTIYIGDYVNFTDPQENRCFRITFADYVENNDISYLRIEDTPQIPNIHAGQGYSVWEAANCGMP